MRHIPLLPKRLVWRQEPVLQHPVLAVLHTASGGTHIPGVLFGVLFVLKLHFVLLQDSPSSLGATVSPVDRVGVQVRVRADRGFGGVGFHAGSLHHAGQPVNPDTQEINLFIPGGFPLDRFRIL